MWFLNLKGRNFAPDLSSFTQFFNFIINFTKKYHVCIKFSR